ncbi:MAG TPA: 5'-3' exonuclease [Enhygromyxa sp.]|jgi:DNA polymerase-1|nr:5'-3' exonuclease [Enhygromyxa sp.]
MSDRLIVIDGDNNLYRAFHAPSDRPPAERFGFWLGRWRKTFNPTHMVVVFDALDGYSWRRELYPAYKSKRPPKPPQLLRALVDARAECRAANIAIAIDDGNEADDLIAAYVEAGVREGMAATIVSSDKDVTQLVRDEPVQVRMHDEVRRMVWGPVEVFNKFGVAPAQLPDLLALIGDSGDGFLGVPGIGPKTAAPLLVEHGDLETLLANKNLVQSSKVMKLLRKHEETAKTAYRLAKLRADIPLPVPLDGCTWGRS